ncbi:DEAD/DEAH box helicase [Victivallis vadensis]|uniref:DEAD/DEAH box helicase n=1 Tax=Victivallis vadensis TaxID=172901 RepID=UPI0023F68CEF|nr:DEAD/DEAH box helicase [Victivallis vadensis]
MNLRPYQIQAQNAILQTWNTGIGKTLLVLPTGTGKTIVFANVIAERVRQGDRVLVLAHREELLNQAADKLERAVGLGCALEKAQSSCLDSWYNVVVGSVQTLQSQKRLDRFPRDYFDTIIVDEAHHAISASYRRVIDHFADARLLGVTATADRGDKRNLGELFETIAYEYTLPAAIRDGYLCPIKALTLPLNIDLAGVKVSAGDFQAAALGSALDPYLEQIAELMREHCAERKTVVFLPLIATSQKMCRILNERGLSAAEVNGESEDRAEILQRFHDGEFKVLCNSMLLTEGWDEPAVDCIVCLRPTKVRALYAQIVGRGTRLFPDKKDLLLLDFLWHTEKHDLCRPAHLVCNNSDLSSRVAEILAEESQGEAVDLLEAEAGAESSAQQEREESLRKLLEEQRKRKRQLVDPLQYEMSIGNAAGYEPDPLDLRQQGPPSAAQLALLEKNGIFPDEVTCAGQASKLLDTLAKRRVEGLTTPKQIRFLERVGFREVGQWRFEDARRMIDRIAANRWTVPYGINPAAYQPQASQ